MRACTWPPGLEASAIGIAATRAARSLSASSRQRTCPPVHHLTSSNAKSRLDRSPARTRGRGAEQQARGRARQGRGPAVGLGPGWLRTRPSGARRRTEQPRGPSNLQRHPRGGRGGRRHGGARIRRGRAAATHRVRSGRGSDLKGFTRRRGRASRNTGLEAAGRATNETRSHVTSELIHLATYV